MYVWKAWFFSTIKRPIQLVFPFENISRKLYYVIVCKIEILQLINYQLHCICIRQQY